MNCKPNNLLLVQLFKKTNPSDRCKIPEWFNIFDAFGYYDSVGFLLISDIQTLIKNSMTHVVGLEQSILLPVTEKPLSFEEHHMGIITFLIIDENKDTKLFDLATQFEEEIVESSNFSPCKAYVTMGASAIALIYLHPNGNQYGKLSESYFKKLQSCIQKMNNIRYTFSIHFFDPTASFQSNEKLKSVYISLAWKPEMVAYAQEQLVSLYKTLDSDSTYGMIPGTYDYFLFAKDVDIKKLMGLFQKDGAFASIQNDNISWYGNFCNSTYTVIGYNVSNMDMEKPDINLTSATNADQSDDYINKLKQHRSTGRISSILDSYSAFVSLKDSIYTKWIYGQYKPIVELVLKLFIDGIKEKLVRSYYMQADAVRFFDVLENVLESLLDTSAYVTNSPGYRKIESDRIPRLLLYYQRILNQLVEKWDARYKESNLKRNHKFILSAQNGVEVQAYMLFKELPPDKRVISVLVPLEQAYMPASLLPLLLHEAGHYVGVRRRQSSNDGYKRSDFFLRLVAQQFFSTFLQNMYDLSMDDLINNFNTPDIHHDIDMSSEIIHAFLSIYEEFDLFLTSLKDAYQTYKSFRLSKLKENASITDTLTNRKIYAINADYFSEMLSMTLLIIKDMIISNEAQFVGFFEHHFRLCINQDTSRRNEFGRMYTNLVSNVHPALQKVLSTMKEANTVDFLTQSEKLLSEIAADMFMVSVTGMSAEQYLALVFEQFMLVNAGNHNLVDCFINTPISNCRVIAIYSELLDRDGFVMNHDILDNMKIRISAILRLDSAIEIEETYIKFCNWIDGMARAHLQEDSSHWTAALKNIFSPLDTACQYAHLLHNDRRYHLDSLKLDPELSSIINLIREIYNTTSDNSIQSLLMGYRSLYNLE